MSTSSIPIDVRLQPTINGPIFTTAEVETLADLQATVSRVIYIGLKTYVKTGIPADVGWWTCTAIAGAVSTWVKEGTGSGFTAGGDLAGSSSSQEVRGFYGKALAAAATAARSVYAYVTAGAGSFVLMILGTAAEKDVPASGDAAAGEVVLGNDTRLISPYVGKVISGTIAVGTGAKTATITAGLNFKLGQRLRVYSATTASYVGGIIDSTGYNSTTGALAFTVDEFSGSGTIGAGGVVVKAADNTGVAPGTYTNPSVTFDAQGRATAAANGNVAPVAAVSVSPTAITGVITLNGSATQDAIFYKVNLSSTAGFGTDTNGVSGAPTLTTFYPVIGTALSSGGLIVLEITNATGVNLWIKVPASSTTFRNAQSLYYLLGIGRKAILGVSNFGSTSLNWDFTPE